MEMPFYVTPYIPTPLSTPLHLRSQQDSAGREGFVGTVKRGREGTPCPHVTLPQVWAEGRMHPRLSSSLLSVRVGHPSPSQVGLLFLLGSAAVSFGLCAGALVREVRLGSLWGN